MAKPRTSKPRIGVRINLPLREDLYQKLSQAAASHHFPITNEIRIRLEDSFTRDTKRGYEALLLDQETIWARYAARFLRLSLEEELAIKLAECKELPVEIASLARLWLKHRADELRPLSGGAS